MIDPAVQALAAYPHLALGLLAAAKSSLIVGATLFVTTIFGPSSSLTRNWAWRAALVSLLGVALWDWSPGFLPSLRPSWRIAPAVVHKPAGYPQPSPPRADVHFVPDSVVQVSRSEPKLLSKILPALENSITQIDRSGIFLFGLWNAVRIAAGIWWLRRISRSGSSRWQAEANQWAAALNLRHPCAAIMCPQISTPLISGWRRPMIYLPEESLTWSQNKLEAVFIHELVHWRRRDARWQIFGAVVACLWWWQPLVWFAIGRLTLSAEQAADDAVVLRQQNNRSYARMLVEMAASAGSQRWPVAMVGCSPLESRIQSLLKDNPLRGRSSRLALAIIILLTCFFLGMGGLYLRTANAPVAAPSVAAASSAVPTPAPTAAIATARVVNADGQPIAGARIWPYCDVRGNTTTYSAFGHKKKTHTGPDGRFSYAVPGFNKVGVLVIASGYARKLALVPYDSTSRDIVLGTGVTVAGRLLKNGQPVPDVEIGIAQVNGNADQFLEEIVAKTDPQGRFELTDVGPNDLYEVHAKRDSLRALGVAKGKRVSTHEPGLAVSAGDLSVETGVPVTGRIMLPEGTIPVRDAPYGIMPDGTHVPENIYLPPVQLMIMREGAYDDQRIDLGPDLRFAFQALPGEEIRLYAWVLGYQLQGREREFYLKVSPDMPPIEMVYDPESAEAKARVLYPAPASAPPTPTPTPQALEAARKTAEMWAAALAAQPHHSESEWKKQFRKVAIGMTFEDVVALLPPKTSDLDYLHQDDWDEQTVHTMFYALDDEFAVALTFDFNGDQAWYAAGQPMPRPKANQNHLISAPVLMRHDKRPDATNTLQMEKAAKV